MDAGPKGLPSLSEHLRQHWLPYDAREGQGGQEESWIKKQSSQMKTT